MMDTRMQTTYGHHLLLSSPVVESEGPALPVFDSLIPKSDYAAILRQHSSSFTYADARLSIAFPADTTELEKLVVGIAALQAFVQTNWTGPAVECDPAELLLPEEQQKDEAATAALNAQAVDALAMHGEPAYHLIKKAAFLWLAREIFDTAVSEQEVPSLCAWRFRLGLVNLRLLDTAVPLPTELLSALEAYIAALSSTSSSSSPSTIRDVQTCLILLVGIYHAQFVHLNASATKQSSETFYSAAQLAGLQYEQTGRMGKKTKFQIDEKSQLVVLARSRERDDGWTPREKMSLVPSADAGAVATSRTTTVQEGGSVTRAPGIGADDEEPANLLLNDDTLLERTHFTSSVPFSTDAANGSPAAAASTLATLDPNKQPVLHPLDEAILLTLSLSITNTSPAHGLTTEQIQSFVTRVLEDGSQNWSIHSMGLLLRSRLEANRSRTVERGLLQIQSLVDQLKLESVAKPKASEHDLDLEKGATPLERLKYFYEMNLPSTWELERELATRFLGLGVNRSAMEIFQRLEMWEDVAKCWHALGEPQKAVRVVRDLLEGKLLESETTMATARGKAAESAPRELSSAQKAKLWCLLGDLENLPEHYETAWEVSGESSSRAMRSLGQAFYSVGKYDKAQECLEKALAINPLFGKVWFVLGCAAMRTEDWPAAERAFRRCVTLDDEDGESWNNMATVLLHQTTSTSTASTASAEEKEDNYTRKRTAYTCLAQAIKHAYDSHRIWINYLLVSVDVGELMETCRAMARIVEMRADKEGEGAVDLEILGRLVDVVVRDAIDRKTGSSKPLLSMEGASSAERGLPGRVRSLFETTILPRIASSAQLYGLYARLLFALDDYQGALAAHMKAYRVEVVLSNRLETDKAEFERAADRVIETVDMLRNLGDRQTIDGDVVMKDWRTQARSMLRSFLGRTKESFGDEASWEKVQEELKEFKAGA